MAATSRGAPDALEVLAQSGPRKTPHSVAERLFREGYAFDFFQAVRLLQVLDTDRIPVGHSGPPATEAVRFRAHASLNFPPSTIFELTRPSEDQDVPVLTQNFLGLTGPSGVLPRHYTELLLRLEKEQRGPERRALRDWLDLFNHRLVSLFYRAWEKYRPYLVYEHNDPERPESDPFILGLLSIVGLGTPSLRNRLRIVGPKPVDGREDRPILSRIDDLVLLYYGGLFAHRPRSAAGLQAIIQDYFQLPVEVSQFQGHWMLLEPSIQSRLGVETGNSRLGVNTLAGDRVWDVQGKIRVRIGPIGYARFRDLLPRPCPVPGRNAFFLLCHLVRLYIGPELDFDIQLILRAEEIPDCQLPTGGIDGPALGWNTWLRSQPFTSDAEDAVFDGAEVIRIDAYPVL